MKQGKGRSGIRVLICSLLMCVLMIMFAGCRGSDVDSTLSEVASFNPSNLRDLTSVRPAEVMPGEIVELYGHGLPTTLEDIRVVFSPAQSQGSQPILGLPFSATSSMIQVVVPTGAPSGQISLNVIENGEYNTIGSRSISVAPLLVGYIADDTPRVPGLVEGNILLGNAPEEITLYGLNVDNAIVSASLKVMGPDRTSAVFQDELSVSSSGFIVENVSDPWVKGCTVALPDRLSDYFQSDSVTYVQFQVRGNGMQSNFIEVPMILRDMDMPGGFSPPFPAFISGVWAEPGVHGNLLEIYYTVFQPEVRLKWRPVLESSLNNGQSWIQVDGFSDPVALTDQDEVSPDYRRNMIIAGDSNQVPEKKCMAGPGTTYRLLVNVSEIWGDFVSTSVARQIRLRLHLRSEEESHSELPNTTFLAPLMSNYAECPYASVTRPLTDLAYQDDIVEAFNDNENYSSRDTHSGLASTGNWGKDGVATGKLNNTEVTGSGLFPLDETVFLEGRTYMYDTAVGRLYLFPDFSQPGWSVAEREALILAVRSQLNLNCESFGLTEVWIGQNNSTDMGELHASRFVLPATVTMYARGVDPLIIRVNGTGSGLSAEIHGEIIVDGLGGGEGMADDLSTSQMAIAGTGGIGGPGGGNGGQGGLVRTGLFGQQIKVRSTEPAEAGEWGGGPGQTMAYLLPYVAGDNNTKMKCFVYGGPGGGGGFGSGGSVGRPSARRDGSNYYRTTNVDAWSDSGAVYRVCGKGGPQRGSDDLLPLMGGSGGGGGGGFLARVNVGSTSTTMFGVGGGGGGGGGGAVRFVVQGSINFSGKISARGGIGAPGRGQPLPVGGTGRDRGDWSGACGGGGSGGAILIQATDSIIFAMGAEMDVSGGHGGRPGLTEDSRYLDSPYYPVGGDGGHGRIRLEASRGVNLPSNINLSGIYPAPSSNGSTTMGPIIKAVDSGNGMHGAVNLSLAEYDGINEFFVSAPQAGSSEEWAAIYYFDAATGDRVEVTPVFLGSRELYLTSLVIPEGKTVYGRGNVPVVIRVQGNVNITGTIDFSGTAGGMVTNTGGIMAPGNGGLAGPGGGNGGTGGYGSYNVMSGAWEMADATGGSLPANLDISGGSVYIPGEGWSNRDLPLSIVAAQKGMSFTPIVCAGNCIGFEDHNGAGGGGGGFGGEGGMGAVSPGDLLENGEGGFAYGYHWHLADTVDDFYGGSGGAGGGASTNEALNDTANPGSGGGGGGGYLLLAVGGDLNLLTSPVSGESARILSDGGVAFAAEGTGGSGGGGSGGALLIRVNGNLSIDNGVEISTRGGAANLDPQSQAALAGTGGDGADGRIRIEYPGGGIGDDNVVQVMIYPEEVAPSVGTVFEGTEVISHVWSRPIALSIGSGRAIMMTDGRVNGQDVTATLLQTSFSSRAVRWSLLVDGSEASCEARAMPDRFFGPMYNFTSLLANDYKPSYMRFMLVFVGSNSTDETPEVDWLSIPWEANDYRVIPEPEPEPGP